MSLVETIKVLTGRILSEDKAKKAENGENASNGEEHLYKDNDGNFVRELMDFEFKTTNDFSYPHIKHTGYYPVESDVRVYDSQRRLIRRRIKQLDSKRGNAVTLEYVPGDFCWTKKIVER